MIKTIQRKSDGKYLKSVEPVEWSDESSEAFEMNIIECEIVRESLGYAKKDLIESLDFKRSKPASKEDLVAAKEFFSKKIIKP